jgi:hypothetical protein
MLIVLQDSEFENSTGTGERPLPAIRTKSTTKLPPSAELWAWAHVHVNQNLIGNPITSLDGALVAGALEAALAVNADRGYSRILCPRRLNPNASYHAFLVPTYEAGRLAGLGEDPAGAASASAPAWDDAVIPGELPYYHRWYFRTGDVGDFEYLVRLLKPQPVDSRVGLRDIDVQSPGANLAGILDAAGAPASQRLGGILQLGGALRIPDISYSSEEFATVEKYRHWATLAQPYPHPFQASLAAFINLSDDYSRQSASSANQAAAVDEVVEAVDPDTEYDIASNPDPLITAPLYGCWHSLTQRLLEDAEHNPVTPNDNWVHELNLDPRWRTAAGFGTLVVQDNQEDYMKAAWDQIGRVLEGNQRVRWGQLALLASNIWYTKHLAPSPVLGGTTLHDRWLAVSAPLQSRVIVPAGLVNAGLSVQGSRRVTARALVRASRVPPAVFSLNLRKQLRPRGPLAKRLAFNESASALNLARRMNEDETLSAAPVRVAPPAFDIYEKLAAGVLGPLPGWIRWLLSLNAVQRWLLLVGLLLVAFVVLALLVPLWLAVLAPLIALSLVARRLADALPAYRVGTTIRPADRDPQVVDGWPGSPDFEVTDNPAASAPSVGGVDSAEAAAFKLALKDNYTLIPASVEASRPVSRPALQFDALGSALFGAVNPSRTISKWVKSAVAIPERITEQQTEDFVEVMAYPRIDLPMYKPLAQRSSELFLPGVQHIAHNSISLLETNQAFIESYLVGLNHEFARELLWREYPCDQRGSTFRQFWEPVGFHPGTDLDAGEAADKVRDIPPIHLWSKRSHLGQHDNRQEPDTVAKEEVVLVIRGELLKKYPTAVIYAQRAVWKDEEGNPIVDPSMGQRIDPARERDLYPVDGNEPSRDLLKTPLYEAKIDPDIYFFGFDLTVCKAKGGSGKADIAVDERCAEEGVTWDDPGWFFVIKERPGEPRFGLDTQEPGAPSNVESGKIEVWNDLAWSDLQPPVPEGSFLRINAQTQTIRANQPLESDDDEKLEQRAEDAFIVWSRDMSSAELAYVLYQVPVLVGVHATEMLPDHGD